MDYRKYLTAGAVLLALTGPTLADPYEEMKREPSAVFPSEVLDKVSAKLFEAGCDYSAIQSFWHFSANTRRDLIVDKFGDRSEAWTSGKIDMFLRQYDMPEAIQSIRQTCREMTRDRTAFYRKQRSTVDGAVHDSIDRNGFWIDKRDPKYTAALKEAINTCKMDEFIANYRGRRWKK